MALLKPTWAHDEDGVGYDWISARLVPESDVSAGIFPCPNNHAQQPGRGAAVAPRLATQDLGLLTVNEAGIQVPWKLAEECFRLFNNLANQRRGVAECSR